jgi:hypothetical protein
MSKRKSTAEPTAPRLVVVRGLRIILDSDLAAIYGVATKVLNQALKRNRARFPEDFAFRLTEMETEDLRSQIVTLNDADISSAPAARKGRGEHRKYLPWAFTEHGALMAANVLRSQRAVEMSVYVVRAFVRQRAQLSLDADVLRRLENIDRKLLDHDESLLTLLGIIKSLLAPPLPAPPPPRPPRPKIGFHP